MAWIWTALSAIIVLYLLEQLLNLKKKKKLPPGPIALPILGHIYQFTKNPHQKLHHLAQKHGPIMYMRLGYVPAIVVSSPATAELVLKTHDLIFAGRPRLKASKYISYDQRNIIFSSYGPYWRNMRKLCTLELLSHLKIKQFQPMRRTELGLLVNSLKQAAEIRETVDISARISALSGDMTCLMVVATPNLGNYFPLFGVLDLQGLTQRMKQVNKTFDEFLEKIIDDHVQNKKNQETQDFVDTMMGIMESGEAGFEFDRRHVKAVLLAANCQLHGALVSGMAKTSC
ncbi:hypothetical protein BUALT_Bualt11G0047300 [Buddleja alternifolia]|uniref:Cytochrome P450 n=1 Tax=Buddleja alternifolia TaxID=168488 RepID=A0AAV6X376_9LAMI|nr:hypothetical protein BUALT_Bualt11G0047300 [Buddleja alternifolia]